MIRRSTAFATATLALLSSSITLYAGNAEYMVTFDATWSQATHPQEFPVSNPHYAYALYSEAHNILYVTVGTCEPIPRIVWNAAIGVRRRLNLKAYSSR